MRRSPRSAYEGTGIEGSLFGQDVCGEAEMFDPLRDTPYTCTVLKQDQTLQDSGKRTRAYRVDGMIDRFQTRYSYQDHRQNDQTACVLGPTLTHSRVSSRLFIIITCIS
jgi:hypothetical protein